MLSGKRQPFCLGLNVLTRYDDGTPTFEVTPVAIQYIHPPHHGYP